MKTQFIGSDGRDIKVATPAKINLFFELLGKRPDGFHEIETVMATVSLYDELYFRRREDGLIRLNVLGHGRENIPSDESNLVYKALELLRRNAASDRNGCDVVLRKRIPAAAGLGGASGNAAGALLAGRQLWGLDVSDGELLSLAAELGSDVPFFLSGGMAVCTGRGEKINSIDAPAGLAVVIVKPREGNSTGEVYRRCVVPENPLRATELMGHAAVGKWHHVADGLFNRLQTFASAMTPSIKNLGQLFDRLDCLGHQMSGSGSAWFGLFRNEAAAHRAAKIATTKNDNRIFVCRTTSAVPFGLLDAADQAEGVRWKLRKSE